VADIIDDANAIAEEHLSRHLKAAQRRVEPGEPGECDTCGEDHPRLVRGRCAPCRDEIAARRRKLGGR
jgi:hypothetical protein